MCFSPWRSNTWATTEHTASERLRYNPSYCTERPANSGYIISGVIVKLQHDQTCILFTVHHEPKQTVIKGLDFHMLLQLHSSYFFQLTAASRSQWEILSDLKATAMSTNTSCENTITDLTHGVSDVHADCCVRSLFPTQLRKLMRGGFPVWRCTYRASFCHTYAHTHINTKKSLLGVWLLVMDGTTDASSLGWVQFTHQLCWQNKILLPI